MPGIGINIYKNARQMAGVTQEKAAECLHLGLRTLADYETGQRRPPSQTVERMAALYGTPMLRLYHAKETDELGVIPRAPVGQRFELVTIQLYTALMDFAERHRGQQLLQIAADGVIDEQERPLFDAIVCEMEGLSAALLALCVGTKKRPSGATEERSTRGETPASYRKLSILASEPDCKPFFEGRCNR